MTSAGRPWFTCRTLATTTATLLAMFVAERELGETKLQRRCTMPAIFARLDVVAFSFPHNSSAVEKLLASG
jgi:hypothetical protein